MRIGEFESLHWSLSIDDDDGTVMMVFYPMDEEQVSE